jgi:hypothetical protein
VPLPPNRTGGSLASGSPVEKSPHRGLTRRRKGVLQRKQPLRGKEATGHRRSFRRQSACTTALLGAPFERRPHAVRPHLRRGPRPTRATRLGRGSRCRHWGRVRDRCRVRHAFLFLRPFAPRPLRRFLATTSALTPARRLFGGQPACTPSCPRRSPCVLGCPVLTLPSPTTPRAPSPLSYATPQRRRFPGLAGLRFRPGRAGSSLT